MSEQKVWVEKMPESCSKCLFCYDNRPYWKSTDCIINHKELDEDEIEIKEKKIVHLLTSKPTTDNLSRNCAKRLEVICKVGLRDLNQNLMMF